MLDRALLAITLMAAVIPGVAADAQWRRLSTAKGDLPLPWQATAIRIVDRPGRLAAGKFKPGRYPQVVLAPGDANGPIRLYECIGDPENPADWRGHDLLDRDAVHAHSLQVADIDADGHLDIFAAEMAKWGRTEEIENPAATAWIWYGDGLGTFRRTVFQEGFGFHEAKLADLDGDGRVDVLSKPCTWEAPRIDVWLQHRPEGTSRAGRREALRAGEHAATGLDRWTHVLADDKREPTSKNNRGSFGISFGDLDGDGDIDLVSGRYFYRNPGADMTKGPWPRVTLPVHPESGRPLDSGLLFDVNGSGPPRDVIAQALPDIVWLHAADDQGEIWSAKVVARVPPTRHGDGRTMRLAKIVPGNPRPDILLSAGGGTYLMQIPDKPEANLWPTMKVTHTEYDEQKSLGLADVDQDGHLDLVLPAGRGRTEVEWWRNPGRASPDWVKHLIGHTTNDAKTIEVADINADGRADVVATDSEAPDCHIYWFEAPADPFVGAWVRHDVARGYEGLDSLSVADMNRDRRPDIVIGETKGRRRLVVYVNEDGGRAWGYHPIDEGKESHKGAQAVDLDGDGDFDLISIAYFAFTDLYVWRNDNK